MNKYKLLISDFDKTLSDEKLNISQSVIQAVHKWVLEGGKFSIASGRQYIMIKKLCKDLNLNTPVIVRGGAEIVDPKTDRSLSIKLIDKHLVSQLIDVLNENDFEISVESDGEIFSDYYYNSKFIPEITFRKLGEFKVKEVPKIIAFAPKDFKRKQEVMKEIKKKFPTLHMIRVVYPDGGESFDITFIDATKYSAVLWLIKLLGLKREEVVGVGDGYNDLPLLEACGFKVAMENAPEELKAVADMIVPDYNHDGFSVLIDKLLKT